MTLLVGSIFHMICKIVSEMTYNVSMGTLNPTIPYQLGFPCTPRCGCLNTVHPHCHWMLIMQLVSCNQDFPADGKLITAGCSHLKTQIKTTAMMLTDVCWLVGKFISVISIPNASFCEHVSGHWMLWHCGRSLGIQPHSDCAWKTHPFLYNVNLSLLFMMLFIFEFCMEKLV